MKRFETFSGYFLTCLGIVLAGVSILVVPADAFADYNGECKACTFAGDPVACAVNAYGTFCGDPSCATACCTDACGSDQTCIDNCLNATQCPYDPVKVCAKAGALCYFGGKASSCEISISGKACTCAPI